MISSLRDQIFFVRHPVFTPKQRVAAYQFHLLGRVFEQPHLMEVQARGVISALVAQWSQLSWERISMGNALLLPLGPHLLDGALLKRLPSHKTTVMVDWRFMQGRSWEGVFKKLRAFHLKVGVSHYDFSEPLPFDQCGFDHVAVDIQAAGPERIIRNMPQLHEKTHWVACHVNTPKQFDVCRHYGFRWLIGRFYLAPNFQVGNEPLRPSQVKVFQVLSRVDDPRLNLEEVALILEQDLVLSEQVVELVNVMARHPDDEPMASILDAVRRLGIKKLKQWLQAVAVGSLGRTMPEIVHTALTRAAFMRCMGQQDVPGTEETYYTIGLFSVLDVIMHQPLVEVLQSMNLTQTVRDAILEKKGRPGLVLSIIEALENEDWETLVTGPASKNMTPAQINGCYLKALDYADAILLSLRLV